MILPPFKDAREFLFPIALSYTELSTLSACEKRWKLTYDATDRESYPATPQMELGTELHNLLNLWWGHGSPDFRIEGTSETAAWLMDRYDEHYMGKSGLQMLETNVPFAVKAFGVWLFGWFDGLLLDENGDLWIAELKSMGDWSRMHQLPIDKQISLYIYAARRSGLDVQGVMFDALLTTHWKTGPDEVYKSGPRKGQPKEYHPAADSFRREWVVRTVEEMEEFEEELTSAMARRGDLRYNIYAPVRNVGRNCSWCPVMPQCMGIEIELTDQPVDDTLDF